MIGEIDFIQELQFIGSEQNQFDPVILFESGNSGAIWEFRQPYLFQDVARTIPVTQDGETVACVFDRSGNGNHLLQATGGLRPVYRKNLTDQYVESLGTRWMRALFSLVQPWGRISALKEISWENNDRILGGGSTDIGILYQTGVTPNIQIFSGTVLDIPNAVLNENFVSIERHHGAQSRGAINDGEYVIGNAGTTACTGITVFANQSGSQIANAQARFIMQRSGILTDDQIVLAREYAASFF